MSSTAAIPETRTVLVTAGQARPSDVLIEVTKGYDDPRGGHFHVTNSPADYDVPLSPGVRFYLVRVNASQSVRFRSGGVAGPAAIDFRVVSIASENH